MWLARCVIIIRWFSVIVKMLVFSIKKLIIFFRIKQRKENYPHEEEAKAKTWIEAVLDIKMEKLFFEELHDGTILCSLLNKLQEGLIPIKHTKPTTMAFKQVRRNTLP